MQKNRDVLDIGSLFCHLSIALKIFGHKVSGVDTKKFIDVAKDRSNNFGLLLKECNLSYGNIPFKDNSFDLVLFTEILEHLNFHPKKIFKEFFRILKSGGKVVITTPNLLRFNNRIKFIIGKSIHPHITEEYTDGTHYREYSFKELTHLAQEANLNLYSVKYADFNYPNNNKLVKILNKMVGFLLPSLRGNIVLVLKKN